MKRRDFMAGVLAMAAIGPLWLREAFARGPKCPSDSERKKALEAALEAAKDAGKPLLVLTVPTANPWASGGAFGEWLNHGGDVALADLSQVVVACALTSDLKALVPSTSSGDPLMRLVDGAQVDDLDVDLNPVTHDRSEDGEKIREAVIDQHIAALSKLLHDALSKTAKPRAERVRATLSSAEQAKVAGPMTGLELTLIDKAAPVLAFDRGNDASVVQGLAQSARKRIVEPPIPGSLWARSGGCGEHIEGIPQDEQMMVACGMGFTPARSARFVRFYSCPAG